MSRSKKPLTPDEVRARFLARGETYAAWAKRHGFKREAVSAVLNGTNKGHRGNAHRIAIALGLKVPPTEESSDTGADRNTQSREAA